MNNRNPHHALRPSKSGWTAVNHQPTGKAIYWGVLITMAEKLADAKLEGVWDMLLELNSEGAVYCLILMQFIY